MNNQIKNILLKFDEVNCYEKPSNFDFKELESQVINLAKTLSSGCEETLKLITRQRQSLTFQVMQKRYVILLVLTMTILSNAFCQSQLIDNLVADSTIFKFRIKQVTENGWGSIQTPKPYWTTIEKYDTIGRLNQRVSINYAYWKFVYDFIYDNNKLLKVITRYYDWNPYIEKSKNDTILKTSEKRYSFDKKKKKKQDPFDDFQTKLSIDSVGRIVKSIDTIKCGYSIVYYKYNENGNLTERKYYITRHDDPPELFEIDSLVYNTKKQKIKETHYLDFTEINGTAKHQREGETIYTYDNLGLLKERLNTTKYLSLKDSTPSLTMYKYEYEFYENGARSFD